MPDRDELLDALACRLRDDVAGWLDGCNMRIERDDVLLAVSEIERLRAELAEARKPDMFWAKGVNYPASNNPEELAREIIEEAREFKGDRVIELRCARRIPNIRVRVWWEETPRPRKDLGDDRPWFLPCAAVVPDA